MLITDNTNYQTVIRFKKLELGISIAEGTNKMETVEDLYDKPEQTFFEDEALDRAFGVVMALATEVYVLRDRQRALERLLEKQGLLDLALLDEEPSDQERLDNVQDRQEFVRSLMINLLGKQQSKNEP